MIGARPLDWFSGDLIEILPAAVYVCDADAVVVAFNKRAAELWGRTPKVGDTAEKFCGAHKLFLTDGTRLPHRETPMEWVLRTGETARDKEVVIERPDGSRVTVLVNIAPIFDVGGKQIGAVNCFQDLSAQKQAEKERGELREELHQARKMQALGQLTGGIAHDFNNMLAGITSSMELVQRRLSNGRTDGLSSYIDTVSRSAERGATLTNRLLAFARRQSLEIRSADVNDLVDSIGDMLRRTLGENIVLETTLKAGVWPGLTDINELENALLNLVINARDAMVTGGRLTIETANVHLDETAARANDGVKAGDYVTISVTDTGCGMPADILLKALDPFFTTKAAGQGTGLGLSTVYGFAQQSGGHLTISSEAGQGTTVTIYLPRATHPAEQRRDGPPSAPRGNGEMVLVVEDNALVRLAMSDTLHELGYRVCEAPDAKAALTILESDQPINLLVTDLGLPNMDGRQLAEIARQHRPGLRVLFVSGYTDEATARGDFVGPGTAFLAKPFKLATVGSKIRELIEGSVVLVPQAQLTQRASRH